MKPEPNRKYSRMSANASEKYRRAVAEEMAAKTENIVATREIAKRLTNLLSCLN